MIKKSITLAGAALFACIAGYSGAFAAYNTNGTAVTATTVTTATSTTTVSAIIGGFTGGGSGASSILGGGTFTTIGQNEPQQRGLSAGGKEGRLAGWVNGAYSTFDEDQSALDSDGDVYAVSAGADWRFTERFLAGLSIGYQLSDVNTTFNAGSLDSNGAFVAPYLAGKVGENIYIDATLGYTMLSTDSKRTSTGTEITGSYDSRQVFGATNMSMRFERGKLAIVPAVGVLYTRQKSDAYTESNGALVPSNTSTLGRARAGARLLYAVNDIYTPYLSGDLEYDFKHDDVIVGAGQTQPTYHDTGAVLGAGVTMRMSERLRGSVEASTVLGKSDFTQYNLSANLRFAF